MAVLSPPDLGAENGLVFPTMHVGQREYRADEVPHIRVDELRSRVLDALAPLQGRIKPAARVAITAGSRGVANIVPILRASGEAVRAAGGEPFIMPAMGSHGGATAEGQREVLEGYGITESFVGCPIHAQMEVVELGKVDGMPVYMDKLAAAADGIVLICRVKPHTNFRAPIESGIVKMMTIGMGKIIG